MLRFWQQLYSDPRDFVYINVEVVERFSESAHVYETNSGLLITSVSVNADEEILSLNFNTVTATPTLQIQANLNSVLRRRDSFVGIANYSTTDNRLRIPALEVTQGDAVLLFTNVVFLLTDAESSIFTLESYDQ
jgi:glutaredoxin-related protein